MQYREGKIPNKNVNKIWNNNECLRFAVGNIATIPPASKADENKSQKKAKPSFLILIPWLVLNSNFSLSKVRWELCFVNTTAVINANQNIILPKGCGIINPEANPINRITANMRFQKLSLLNLEAIKPFCGLAEFCSSIALLSFSSLQNVAKSSMKTYCNYWFKTYNSIISNSHHVLKQIIRNIRKLLSKFYKNIVNIASLRYYSGITITYRYKTMRDILLNVRTDTATKELLKEAAAMLGTTVTGFLLSTATKEAHELINNKHHFFLNNEQWNKFCSALDDHPKENKALQKLLSTKGVFDE